MRNRVDLEHLRTLATAASPGPWEARPNELIGGTAVYPHDSDREVADFTSPADARYIAAVNPTTVLAMIHLVTELQAARKVVEAAKNLDRTTGNPNAATRVAYANAALDAALVAYDQTIGG